MARKVRGKTAERILGVALDLLNRFGEPNVSTTLISAELGISPGNLYYHFAAKDVLINALFERFSQGLHELLAASDQVRDVEDAWFFVQAMLELIWNYRFLYRDLNDLLSNNRQLETEFKALLLRNIGACKSMLASLEQTDALHMQPHEAHPVATNMVLVLTYWLNFEYACDPRQALEPHNAHATLQRGVHQVLHLLLPYLNPRQRSHLLTLIPA